MTGAGTHPVYASLDHPSASGKEGVSIFQHCGKVIHVCICITRIT